MITVFQGIKFNYASKAKTSKAGTSFTVVNGFVKIADFKATLTKMMPIFEALSDDKGNKHNTLKFEHVGNYMQIDSCYLDPNWSPKVAVKDDIVVPDGD